MNTTSSEGTVDQELEFRALQTVITALQPFPPDVRVRIYEAVGVFLKIGASPPAMEYEDPSAIPSRTSDSLRHPRFSDDRSMAPKEFLLEKQPQTDVERVACLAYYLTHYGDAPHFKTLDISKLNIEAAQPKFTNAANAASNAVKMGYLVQATKGHRQLSAAGERFVQALPDRAAAREAMATARPKKRQSRSRNTSSNTSGD